jgi:hypothetical protein
MDSYIVRIYRRSGGKPRILVGTVETAGTRRKIAFSNIEELWEILRRRKSRVPCAPHLARRRIRKEVMNGTDGTGLEESAEGVRKIESTPEW